MTSAWLSRRRRDGDVPAERIRVPVTASRGRRAIHQAAGDRARPRPGRPRGPAAGHAGAGGRPARRRPRGARLARAARLRREHRAAARRSCAGSATTSAAGTSAVTTGRPRRCWPACPGPSSIMPNGPGVPSPWSAGAWAAYTPGRWPAVIPVWSGRSSPWAARSPCGTCGRATPTARSSGSGTCTPPRPICPRLEQRAKPISVPSTAVYSRLDGVVAWQTCIEPETALHQNVEVRCSHLGFGADPATLWLIADRLAVPGRASGSRSGRRWPCGPCTRDEHATRGEAGPGQASPD